MAFADYYRRSNYGLSYCRFADSCLRSLLAVYRLPSERVLEIGGKFNNHRCDRGKRQRAISFALLSSCFFALNNCFDRVAVQTATPVFSGMMMTVLSGLVLAPIALRQGGGRDSLNRAARPFSFCGGPQVFYMALRLSALVVSYSAGGHWISAICVDTDNYRRPSFLWRTTNWPTVNCCSDNCYRHNDLAVW